MKKMPFSAFPKLLTSMALILGSLVTNLNTASARPAPSERGFWCDETSGVPLTLYQNAVGNTETWIAWRSPVFNNLGYTPQARCKDVSQNFETQRQTGKLGFLTSSTFNEMTVICAAQAPGVCDGALFTVNDPSQVVDILGQLIALRDGIANTPPIEL